MSPEALIPAIGAACAALGAGLAKWGPELFRLAREWVRSRTKLRLRAMESEAHTREETQRTFEELGSQRERIKWLKRELDRERELRQRLEGELTEERAARKQLEARVQHLEGLVLDMIGPAAPPASNVAELKKGRRR